MAKANISKRTVDAAKPTGRDQFLWDDEISGFGLKVTPVGGKVYVFQYRVAAPGEAQRTPAKRYTIGKHGALTPDQARKRARELAGMVAHGIDPRLAEHERHAAQKQAAHAAAEKVKLEFELAFDKVADRWLDHYEYEKDRRASSIRQAKLVVNKYLKPALGSKPMPHVARGDLQPIIDGIPIAQRGMRRAVFAYASVLFGWAVKRGDIPANPLAEMAKPEAPKSRDRVLTDDELGAIWKASETLGSPFGPFFRLLIASGQRRSEVAGLNWSELDRDMWTWTVPADRAKNGVAHIVPLNELTIAELDTLGGVSDGEERPSWPKEGLALTTTGKTPISGISKAKNALDAAIAKSREGKPLPAWRIHDLRRTLATGFQRLGVRFEVTEAVLNHVGGAKGGIAGIYQRYDWRGEKRTALDAWARHIGTLLNPSNGENIIPLEAGNGSNFVPSTLHLGNVC